jgi:hypothetical protein
MAKAVGGIIDMGICGAIISNGCQTTGVIGVRDSIKVPIGVINIIYDRILGFISTGTARIRSVTLADLFFSKITCNGIIIHPFSAGNASAAICNRDNRGL